MHISASKKAIDLGEAYIFACHADLNHIVYPLISKNVILGSILVGPFLMDTPDSILISDITKKYTFSTEEALELYDETSSIPVIAPSLVNHVSHLLFYLFSNLITDSKKELLKITKNCFSNPGSVNPSNAIKPKISRQIPILMKKKKN